MAPARKGTAALERHLFPRIGDRETNRLAPVFDLAEVKALLAPDAKAGGEPYTDADYDGGVLPLPAVLKTATAEWKRAKLLAADSTGAPPYVLEATIDPGQPRELTNGLLMPTCQAESALPLLEWITSTMQLIAEHAPALRDGDYLWQLIHPQTDARVPLYSDKGRYVVRLFDHGQWRAITIDDTLPCDATGHGLLPRTLAPRELWPSLLTKALLKLGARTSAGLRPRDPSVLTALTGWLPQVLPIAPASQPDHLTWDALTAALGANGTIVALAADEPVDDERRAELARSGVRTGPLLSVVEARSALGGNYVRLTSELVQWRGRLCDTDEASWTVELDGALGWKRRQRLRKVAAGATLRDFWTDEPSLCSTFGELVVWRDPTAQGWLASRSFSGISYSPGHADALLHVGAVPPTADGADGGAGAAQGGAAGVGETVGAHDDAARAPGATPVLIALTVSPAGGRAELPCWARLERFSPDEPLTDAGLLHLDATRIASMPLALRPGTYRLSVHSASELSLYPSFFHFTLHVCAATRALALGDAPTVLTAELARKGGRLEGERAVYPALEAHSWGVLIRARLSLKAPAAHAAAPGADEAGRVPVVVELLPHDERAAEHVRLHLIDNDGCDESSLTHLRGAMRCLPGAQHTLLVDACAPVNLDRATYALDVRAPVDAELSLETVLPAVDVLGRYVPSYAQTAAHRFVLCRYVATGATRSHAAMRIALSDPDAELTVRVYRLDKHQAGAAAPSAGQLLKSKEGVGSVTLAAVPLELAEMAKGASGTRIIVEVTLSRGAVERLGLLREPCAQPPDPAHPLDPPPRPPVSAAPRAPGDGTLGDRVAGAPPADADDGPALTYKLSALSDVVVTLTADDERAKQLDALKAAWEAKEAGRRARGRASRTAFLVSAGGLSAEDAATLVHGKETPVPAGKGGAKAPLRGAAGATSKPGSRAHTPALGGDQLASRAALWREPTVRRAASPADARLVDEAGKERARAALAERVQAAAAQREALALARAAHAAPRNELVASLAQGHAEWRSAVSAMAAQFGQTWEALRAERKPPDEEPVATVKPVKKDAKKK
ncbi:hypothetical protein KFE25_004027 [Diacronema lutheri]|uniref:Calpain catalytic domain-containing protein n=1 Tax=Diacronema lutheri TaxID=2081491 RepID=A0A8J5XFT6_DIALT|nr:hypothetical protein KFE25_004027 [Diacronema lutheri]